MQSFCFVLSTSIKQEQTVLLIQVDFLFTYLRTIVSIIRLEVKALHQLNIHY